VFSMTSAGALTTLHSFQTSEGTGPSSALALGNDGNFYGVATSGGVDGFGTIFEITPAGNFTTLYTFGGAEGENPIGIVQHTSGSFYGTAMFGGSQDLGTLFSLNVGLIPFVSLQPISGKVGKTVRILGQGFTGATAVMFNGNTAKFKVVSGSFLTAVVPHGATTGPVTVTTPGRILTSNRKFQVQ